MRNTNMRVDSTRGLDQLSVETVARIVDAAIDRSRITGLTHQFYRYPARFSPVLVRAVIEAFSNPGDVVLDPFMGGGTTLVEALAMGRQGIGSDISSLAAFVSEVKTTLYSEKELKKLSEWVQQAPATINIHLESPTSDSYSEAGYYKHLDRPSTWRIRKAIDQSLATAVALESKSLEAFARCVILRTAQWALDGRKNLPTVEQFRVTLTKHGQAMIEGARELGEAVDASGSTLRSVSCLNRSIEGLETDATVIKTGKPRLVVTSPPYPGVHVLYHRWQVDGRKETPAPFWIANKLDGDGSAYYTMGDRKAHQLNTYFEKLAAALKSVAAICDKQTTVVQIVAFSEPEWQLPRYLSVADEVGLKEEFLPALGGDGRLWRGVPNRKWHAEQGGATSGSQEVVLFHRLR